MSCAFQIDGSVVLVMKDEQLRHYLPAYGDRVATVAWLNSHTCGANGNAPECRPQSSVLSRLRQKIAQRKHKCGNSEESACRREKLRCNTNAMRESRRIEVGWHDFDPASQTHKQVRIQNGGGIRHLSAPTVMTVEDVLQTALQLFFPDGKNKKGDVGDFDFHIRSFDGSSVGHCTLGELYERTKVKMLRLNIFSCKKTDVLSTEQLPVTGSHVTKRLVLDNNNFGSNTSAKGGPPLDDSVSILIVQHRCYV